MIESIVCITTILLLQACVSYPKQVPSKDYKRCELVSKEYRLEMNDVGLKVLSDAGDPLGALVLSGIVVSITTVVSGSVVIVGNTVHFLEKQGRCDDSFLNAQVLNHITPLLNDGGKLVNATGTESIEITEE